MNNLLASKQLYKQGAAHQYTNVGEQRLVFEKNQSVIAIDSLVNRESEQEESV